MTARYFSTVDGLVQGKFKFLNNIGRIMKETESVQEWLAHHTAKATDEVILDQSMFWYSNYSLLSS